MQEDTRLKIIRQRTRRRFYFTGITLALYFSFTLAWTEAGSILTSRINDGPVNAAMLMFIGLIITFILLEFVFMRISNREAQVEQTRQKAAHAERQA